jgi:hypothetical protein
MDNDTKAAIDERVEWVKAVVADAMDRGGVAIREAIENLDDEDYPGLLFMFLSNRVTDERRIREMLREQAVEELESLDGFADTA